jgi:hypothetical protein
MDGNAPDAPPFVVVPREEDRPRWDKVNARLAAVRQEMTAARDTAAQPFETWLQDRKPEPVAQPLDAADTLYTADITQPMQFEKAGGVSISTPPKLDADKPFTISVNFFFPKAEQSYAIATQHNNKDKNRGWILDIGARELSFRLIGNDGDNIEVRAAHTELLQPGTWNQVVVTYDGSRLQSALDMFLNGHAIPEQHRGVNKLLGYVGVDDPLVLGKSLAGGAISDFRIFGRVVTEAEAHLLSRWPSIQTALALPTGQIQDDDRAGLLDYFLFHSSEPYRNLAAEQNRLNLEAREVARRGATTLVMQERTDQKPFAYVLYRGAYDQRRDRVEANTPSALPPMAAALPHNRLGLARWLFTEDHPLTARVAVNRMWQEVFGAGIVRTPDDFGSQGDPPSHPQLLDWLAVDFHESGWDLKRFYRQILTSATYRQQAVTTPEKLATDPENRLLSRGPRFRMDAEMLRDYALAASGLLAPQIGGPSVRPYQPDGIWEAVAMLGSNTRFYKADSGSGLYRRSLYTFWKRAAAPAAMEILNAPTREFCVVRRERTDTPLQALATMNDVQFVEAARVLAGAAMESSTAFDGRLDYLAARVLLRPLNPGERSIMKQAYDDFARYYSAHPDDARKFLDDGERKPDPALPSGELAALSMVANQFLNLDEVLNQ